MFEWSCQLLLDAVEQVPVDTERDAGVGVSHPLCPTGGRLLVAVGMVKGISG